MILGNGGWNKEALACKGTHGLSEEIHICPDKWKRMSKSEEKWRYRGKLRGSGSGKPRVLGAGDARNDGGEPGAHRRRSHLGKGKGKRRSAGPKKLKDTSELSYLRPAERGGAPLCASPSANTELASPRERPDTESRFQTSEGVASRMPGNGV